MIAKCWSITLFGLILAAGARLAADEPRAAGGAEERPLVPPVIEDEPKPDVELLKSLNEKLGDGDHSDDPLLRAGRRMREVQQRITRADTGAETQTEQKQIVKDLDELIERIKNGQCPSCGGSCSGEHRQQDPQQAQKQKPGNSGQQAANRPSTEGARQAGRGRLEAVQKDAREDVVKREWGHLPEQERLRMIQELKAAYLPKYEELLNRYYETLSNKSRAERR